MFLFCRIDADSAYDDKDAKKKPDMLCIINWKASTWFIC